MRKIKENAVDVKPEVCWLLLGNWTPPYVVAQKAWTHPYTLHTGVCRTNFYKIIFFIHSNIKFSIRQLDYNKKKYKKPLHAN